MIADKIKELREKNDMTQSDLARKLSITRSAINAWEMGISVPSTQYIVELALLFNTSTDYILDMSDELLINISNLNHDEQEIVFKLLNYFNKG